MAEVGESEGEGCQRSDAEDVRKDRHTNEMG